MLLTIFVSLECSVFSMEYFIVLTGPRGGYWKVLPWYRISLMSILLAGSTLFLVDVVS